MCYPFQARDAFAVLSTQIIDYMKTKNIIPNRPKLSMDTNSSSLSQLAEMNGVEQASLRMSRSSSVLSERSIKSVDKSGRTICNIVV